MESLKEGKARHRIFCDFTKKVTKKEQRDDEPKVTVMEESRISKNY